MQTFSMTNRQIINKDDKPCSLDEVAQAIGVSRQAVELIEKRALRKLRDECARRGLRLEDLTEGF